MSPTRHHIDFQRAERVVGAVVFTLALLGVLGHWVGVERLYRLAPDLPPLHHSAGVSLALLGAALLARSLGRNRLALGAAALSALWGAATLAAYAGFGGAAWLLGKGTLAPDATLMSLNAALCAALAGAGLFIVALGRSGDLAIGALSIFGAGTIGIGAVAVFGYLSGIGAAMVWGGATEMAPQAALSYTAVGALLISAAWRSDGDRTTSRARWMASAIGVGLLIAMLGFWRAFENEWERQGLASNHLSTGLLIGIATITTLTALLFYYALAAHLRGQQVRQALAALERRALSLATSNAQLRRFAEVAAHDLKEPLREVAIVTQSFRRTLTGRLDTNELKPLDDVIETAKLGAARLDVLVDYSGLSEVTLRPTSMNHVLARVLRRLGPKIEAAGATVDAEPLPTLPADAGRMTKVFEELINNSLRFRGSEPPRVRIAARADGRTSWVFSVEDNGRGIPAAYHEKAFALFSRINDAGAATGLGAGLAICKRAVEAHGGKMWLESEVGRSTKIFFTLPAQEDEGTNPRREALLK
jgi:signal transduction histidine kinase